LFDSYPSGAFVSTSSYSPAVSSSNLIALLADVVNVPIFLSGLAAVASFLKLNSAPAS